ncbi:MAG: ATP synthase F1 subunit delta [Polyangiales bacterium]
MIGSLVARRYAKALIELGQESSGLDALVREIHNIAQAIETSAELKAVLTNPQVPLTARKAVLSDIADRLGAGRITRNTVALLADRGRLSILSAVALALRDEADRRSGVVRAQITSAAPLSEIYVHKLTEALEARFKKKVLVQREVDPSLLAGVVTRVGDTVIDGSLRARLTELTAELLPH